MGRFVAAALLSLIVIPRIHALTSGPAQIATVNVRVYDYASVPRNVLESSEKECSRILSGARLRIAWMNCEQPSQWAVSEDCRSGVGATELDLRLVPGFAPARAGLDRTVLGYAVPSTTRMSGSLATVYYGRAQELAQGADPPVWHVLAVGIAHELGHLLLPDAGHGDLGLMRAVWSPLDLGRLTISSVLLTRQQCRQIHLQVLRWLSEAAFAAGARAPSAKDSGASGPDPLALRLQALSKE